MLNHNSVCYHYDGIVWISVHLYQQLFDFMSQNHAYLIISCQLCLMRSKHEEEGTPQTIYCYLILEGRSREIRKGNF